MGLKRHIKDNCQWIYMSVLAGLYGLQKMRLDKQETTPLGNLGYCFSFYERSLTGIRRTYSRLTPPGVLTREHVGLSRETSSVSPACRKRRLNWAVCRNHRTKWVVPCRCRTGTLKRPAKCLWRWESDRRYNFFSPPAHI